MQLCSYNIFLNFLSGSLFVVNLHTSNLNLIWIQFKYLMVQLLFVSHFSSIIYIYMKLYVIHLQYHVFTYHISHISWITPHTIIRSTKLYPGCRKAVGHDAPHAAALLGRGRVMRHLVSRQQQFPVAVARGGLAPPHSRKDAPNLLSLFASPLSYFNPRSK